MRTDQRALHLSGSWAALRWSGCGILFLLSGIVVLLAASTAEADPGGRVYPNAESVQPRAVKSRVPSAQIRDLDGKPVDLAKLVSESGALLVFYRGGW